MRSGADTALVIGIDVGGTFTDAVGILPDGVVTEKVITTERQEDGVLQACSEILSRLGPDGSEGAGIVHGSTVATNALLERRGARTAFVATEGFRDLLWLGRQARPSLYRLCEAPPTPVVEREWCFEVPERVGPEGVIRPLDEAAVRRLGSELARLEGLEAVAICLLFSFVDPSHEERTAEILRELLPDVFVVASHELLPEVREYERATTVALDAYVGPPARRYLANLSAGLRESGLPDPLIMLSSGGVTQLEQAAAHPAGMMLSGPAGGVVAARLIAEKGGHLPAIGLDMGGTSCDVFFLGDDDAQITVERKVAGLPLRLPMVDIHTVSAGGGSVAWVDSGGALRVGPRSAGAWPGPACYGRGGTEVTVTDAALVLGYLPSDHEIAGHMHLDVASAEAALSRLAEAAGYLTSQEAAEGVYEVATHEVVRALHVVSVERGHDPEQCTVIAFGGAGPVHACAVADLLGSPRVVCVRAGGVLCALGLALADQRVDRSLSVLRPLASFDRETLAAVVRRVAGTGEEDGISCAADLRYRGQSFELTVPFAFGAPPAKLEAAFHQLHDLRYGHAHQDWPVEVVTLRAWRTSEGAGATLSPDALFSNGLRPVPEERPAREIRWNGKTVLATVVDGGRAWGATALTGPAIVEFAESTCVVPAGWSGATDENGFFVLSRGA
ncbi:MAG TPA: hydantoinase/oxoprolinase family protein [Gaiellaceae bacterium]|nr:hydantoinase/oxoprolinase family protein [Gaiellaceae bacterium]